MKIYNYEGNLSELARQLGVDTSTVTKIKRGIKWAWLTGGEQRVPSYWKKKEYKLIVSERYLEELFLQCNRELIYFAKRYLFDDLDAEDEVMFAFMDIGAVPEMEFTKARQWLYTSVRQRCLNTIKKNKRHRENNEKLADLQRYEYTDATYVKSDLLGKIWEEIKNLSGKEQEVMNWLYKEDLSSTETADKMGISIDTVRVLKARALKKLRSLDL